MSARVARGSALITALVLAGCASTSEAPRNRESRLSLLARGLRHPDEIRGPIFVAPPSFERAAEVARAARWPLPAPAEVELSAIASAWQNEVERALFAAGLSLAAHPGPEVWTVALDLLQLSPDDHWLNSRGAEDAYAAGWGSDSGATSFTYALRNPDGKEVMRWHEPLTLGRPPIASDVAIDRASWSATGRQFLLASAVTFAQALRPARNQDQ
ncbi:MAG: hypothetical protein JNM84_14355 [Planctomycetes bacterium]|nr:hypothetical protein [Planctomycetota bacterium]